MRLTTGRSEPAKTRMNEADLRSAGFERQRDGSFAKRSKATAGRPVPDAEPQRDQAPALDVAAQGDLTCNLSGPRQFDDMPRGGSSTRPIWTPVEDAALCGFYQQLKERTIDLHGISKHLNRSEAACAWRANQLGLTMNRGEWQRPPKRVRLKKTQEQISAVRSLAMIKVHQCNPHPMLGKPVPNSVREKISKANAGRQVPPERVLAGLKTRFRNNGTLAPNHPHGSWKSGWREIGGKRIYARSRWEANYARYLEWLKHNGHIIEWEHEPETFWFENIRRGCRSYLPDFRVTFTDRTEYHETKGWMDARSKTKIKRMAKYHPSVVLVVIDSKWFKANRIKLRGLISGWEDGR